MDTTVDALGRDAASALWIDLSIDLSKCSSDDGRRALEFTVHDLERDPFLLRVHTHDLDAHFVARFADLVRIDPLRRTATGSHLLDMDQARASSIHIHKGAELHDVLHGAHQLVSDVQALERRTVLPLKRGGGRLPANIASRGEDILDDVFERRQTHVHLSGQAFDVHVFSPPPHLEQDDAELLQILHRNVLL